MRIVGRIAIGLVAVIVVVLGAAAAWLAVAPPDLLRIATGYSAKIVCSNVFLAARNASEVLAEDVQAPGHPILKFVSVNVDEAEQTVTARLFGFAATSIAIYRPGLGCASVPDGDVAKARAVQLAPQDIVALSDAPWPQGSRVEAEPDEPIAAVLADESLTGPGMRAVVVVKDGRIVAEQYGPGFDAGTPLLGWSMAKSVTGILLGTMAQGGKLSLNDTRLFPEWAGDGRKDISVRDLASMSSGLEFNEDYGDVSDVNRMLFLEPDMSAFAARQAAVAAPGAKFNYSSGTAVMLSRLWMNRLGDEAAALAYPRQALFGPLGMTSAVLEADERGNFVGSSHLYATARDWARIGLLLLDNGVWQGQRLLPSGWVALMGESNGLAGGYSKMLSWVEGPHESEPDDSEDYGLPGDAFWLQGHDGQTIAVVPSERLVVVRLGLTPWKLDYRPEYLLRAVVGATE